MDRAMWLMFLVSSVDLVKAHSVRRSGAKSAAKSLLFVLFSGRSFSQRMMAW